MANYAEIRVHIEKAYGLPWRLGDVVAGELHFRDRDRNLLTLGNNTSIETQAYEFSNGTWSKYGAANISTSSTSTDGIYEFTFEPADDEIFRLVFKLTGDYKAQSDVTVKVLDPVSS